MGNAISTLSCSSKTYSVFNHRQILRMSLREFTRKSGSDVRRCRQTERGRKAEDWEEGADVKGEKDVHKGVGGMGGRLCGKMKHK